MTDYTKLVKELRGCKYIDYCKDCPRMAANGYVEICNIKDDAADAIEALQAYCEQLKTENTMLYNTITADRGVMFEWIQSLAQQLPMRGEWIRHPEVKNIYGGEFIECPFCGEKYVVQYIADEKFCRNCGADMRAKMEVQDGV